MARVVSAGRRGGWLLATRDGGGRVYGRMGRPCHRVSVVMSGRPLILPLSPGFLPSRRIDLGRLPLAMKDWLAPDAFPIKTFLSPSPNPVVVSLHTDRRGFRGSALQKEGVYNTCMYIHKLGAMIMSAG